MPHTPDTAHHNFEWLLCHGPRLAVRDIGEIQEFTTTILDGGLFFAIGFSDVSDSYKNDRGSSVSLGHGQEAFCLIQIGL